MTFVMRHAVIEELALRWLAEAGAARRDGLIALAVSQGAVLVSLAILVFVVAQLLRSRA